MVIWNSPSRPRQINVDQGRPKISKIPKSFRNFQIFPNFQKKINFSKISKFSELSKFSKFFKFYKIFQNFQNGFSRLRTLKSYINLQTWCVPTAGCESQVSFGAKVTTNLRHSSLWTMTPETDKKPGQRQRPSWRKTKAREPDNSPEERQQTWWLTKTLDSK